MTAFLQHCRHWVFDMDGTLTQAVHDFDYIRQQLDIPAQADILGHLDSLPATQAAAAHAWLMQHEYQLAKDAQAADGARELVEYLYQQGHQLSILTRNAHSLVRVTLEAIGLHDYFHEQDILGREQAAPKPSPEGMLKIASQWQACPSRLTMIGDFHFDLTSAKQAGANSILVHADGNLWPQLCDLHSHSCHELLQLIQTTAHG